MFCRDFECKETQRCPCCYNGKCTGVGYDASSTCACGSCINFVENNKQNKCKLNHVPTEDFNFLKL